MAFWGYLQFSFLQKQNIRMDIRMQLGSDLGNVHDYHKYAVKYPAMQKHENTWPYQHISRPWFELDYSAKSFLHVIN